MLSTLRSALACVAAFTLLAGVLYPFAVTVIAQIALPTQAHGSLALRSGRVVGSELLGQRFVGPGYFHSRPSAAGDGYDATASGGTNLGPTNRTLIADVGRLAADYRRENGLPESAPVPADAVTRSGSGLDPHISPENAALQAPRVAAARGVPLAHVRPLVDRFTEGRTLGVFGEPRVAVFRLNRALDEQLPGRR